jgi:peptide chain release factor 1
VAQDGSRGLLDELDAELEALRLRLADPEAVADRARFAALARRLKELEQLHAAATRRERARADAALWRQMASSVAPDEREAAEAELAAAEAELAAAEAELAALLAPRDPNDGRDVVVEIRGAEGGEEANLFARDLFEMYRRYAERRGWALEVLSARLSERDGFDEVIFRVRGPDAWQRLKHEAGPHRVQRVPVTESQGRIHTSSATVVVLPEPEELEVRIDPAELRIDVFRATGPGGQSVNTTDSAVRITHLPTGITVSMQDEKSQLQNRTKALAVLRARLFAFEQARRRAEESATRREQVRGGGRAEKIRTYNFRDNRVTDHRIGLTLYKLDRVLEGELDHIVEALLAHERERKLAVGQADAGSPAGHGAASRSGPHARPNGLRGAPAAQAPSDATARGAQDGTRGRAGQGRAGKQR